MFFYAVLPFFLLCSTRRLFLIYLPICVALIAGCLIAVEFLPWFQKSQLKFFPPARLLEFLVGVLTARIFISRKGSAHSEGPTQTRAAILCGVGLFMMLLWFFSLAQQIAYPWFRSINKDLPLYFWYCGGALFFGLGIFCFATADSSRSKPFLLRFLASRPMQLLGNASFAVYLIHIPIRHAIAPEIYRPSWGLWAYFALVHVVAISAYLLVERPAQRWLNHWYRQRKNFAAEKIAVVPQPIVG